MPQMSQVLRERAVGMLTAGMSTRAKRSRAVAREIECSFLYHKPSTKAFQRIWQYIQPASRPQTTCTSPGSPHPASSPPETSHPDSYSALQSKKAVTTQSAELRKMTFARAFCSYCTNDKRISAQTGPY